MQIEFCIPGPAVGLARNRAVPLMRDGKPVLSPQTGRPVVVNYKPKSAVSYDGLVKHEAQEVMAGRPPLECAVSVVLDIRCMVPSSDSRPERARKLSGQTPPTKKPDVDNVVKAVFDGMTGVVWKDDVQCVDLRVRKRYAQVPGVAVTVEPVLWVHPVQCELPIEPVQSEIGLVLDEPAPAAAAAAAVAVEPDDVMAAPW